jgi:DNA repair exonuclease SbcCD nuclease subunit
MNIYFSVHVVMLSTMLLFGRLSKARSAAWISPLSSHVDTRRVGVVGLQHRLVSTKKGSSSLKMVQWEVGDSAMMCTNENDELTQGFITELRGRGWYTIQLLETKETIKCRSTQLRRLSTSTATKTTTTATSSPIIPSFKVDPGLKLEYAPPPPTIYDFDAAILARTDDASINPLELALMEQVAHHASFQKWVVFTDLHCSPSSLDTCLQVLHKVHEVAVAKKAGVLFLGDFWHHRGTLRVDCLNAVLDHFKTWKVAMVMIPGNHDQVTLGGHNHGLSPLENAYRIGSVAGPLVLSYPTKFLDALLVPHVRDIATMESILQSTEAKEARALFVHADVTGAYMNDLIVSQGGVSPSSFPPSKPIYSGHFHKPHTVQSGDVKIEYFGSPYETSLAEAQQPKALAILDASQGWQCIEYVPLDIGRKHFKITSSFQNLFNLHPTNNDLESHTGKELVKPGDRVVVTVPKEEVDGMSLPVRTHIKELRKAGITVEINEVKNVASDPMGSGTNGDASRLEEMTTESTWRAFLTESVRRGTMTDSDSDAMIAAGLEIVDEVESKEGPARAQSLSVTDLHLNSVTLEGFGPFKESATYPLLNRGLVLLRGTNSDGGSDR